MRLIYYSPVYSYLKAHLSKMLSWQDYETLIKQKDFKGNIIFLFNKLSVFLVGVRAIEDLTEERLEHLLKLNLILLFQKIGIFAKGKSIKKFLKLIYIFVDFYNLKILLRSVTFEQYKYDDIKKYYLMIPGKQYHSYDILRSIDNLGKIFLFVDRTIFKKIFSKAFVEFDRTKDLETFEDLISKEFYNLLSNEVDCLFGADKKISKNFLEKICDMENIYTFLRLKFLYGKENVFIRQKIINIGSISNGFLNGLNDLSFNDAFKKVRLKIRWCNFDDIDIFFKKENINTVDIITKICLIMETAMVRYCRKLINFDKFSIGAPLGFCYLKQVELNNIIKILIGLKMEFSEEQIKNNLVKLK